MDGKGGTFFNQGSKQRPKPDSKSDQGLGRLLDTYTYEMSRFQLQAEDKYLPQIHV